jgi:hypothetical protein
MCWFEAGVTTSFGPPRAVDGLGFLRGGNSVHHHSEPERRRFFREAVAAGAVPPGYAVDDGAGLLFAGTALVDAVAARPGAGAWHVETGPGGDRVAVERPLEPRTLRSEREPGRDPSTPLSIAEYRELRARRGALNRLGSYSAESESPW